MTYQVRHRRCAGCGSCSRQKSLERVRENNGQATATYEGHISVMFGKRRRERSQSNTKVENPCRLANPMDLGHRDGGSKSAGKTTDRPHGQTAIHIDERSE